jgi:putative sterol carrier protein
MAKVPETAQQLFNVDVPEALKKHPDKAREIGAVYLFKISGDGGGTWTVDLTANPPTVSDGDKGNAQCTFEVAHDDFKQMLTNPAMGMQLYFQGKLKVTGDPMLATKLQKLFQLNG